MRKIIVLLFVLVSAVYVKAQDAATVPPKLVNSFFGNTNKRTPCILDDKISADGRRFLWGNYRSMKHTFDNKWAFFVGLLAIEKDESKLFQLRFFRTFTDVKPMVKDKSPVLFKFADGSVIETMISGDAEGKYECRDIMGHLVDTYELNFYVDLTQDIVDGLKKGFSKMRFELNNDIYDVEMKSDNISDFILQEYLLMQEALSKKRDFKEGF